MGLWSIAQSVGAQAISNVRKAVRDPLGRLRKKIVRKTLKSKTANKLHNTVIRFLTSEILLAVIVCVASATTYKPDMQVYNYVLPCVVSALCTEFMRKPLNALCDDYTQPVADKVQSIVVQNWDNEGFWIWIKQGTGITLGLVAIGLSSVNDVNYTIIFVTQTLLTSFVVGLVKKHDHPLKQCCRRRLRNCRDRPMVRMDEPIALTDNALAFEEDPEDELLIQPRLQRPKSVRRIVEKVRARKAMELATEQRTTTRVIRIQSETDLVQYANLEQSADNLRQESKPKEYDKQQEYDNQREYDNAASKKHEEAEELEESEDVGGDVLPAIQMFPALINDNHFSAGFNTVSGATLSSSDSDGSSEDFFVIPVSRYGRKL